MPSTNDSLLISDLSWPEVGEHLVRDQRLIVPVGALDQYGPHLPLGASTRIVEAFARDLSQDFQVLRAPPVSFGVNVPSERYFPGTATVRAKTLHQFLNDLLASWEDHGFREFILLTIHDYDSHVEAIATVTGTHSRVRIIEIFNMDLSEFRDGVGAPEHGGEATTALMLHLYPESVRMDLAIDYAPTKRAVSPSRRVTRIPEDSPGSLGSPALATPEKGRRLYEYIYEKIRTRVFVDPG
jgi:creatinine amidohydrolase